MRKICNVCVIYLGMSFLFGCSGSSFESEHIDIARIDHIKKGKSQWIAGLDDSVGPMWEISFGERGSDISDFIKTNSPANCTVQLKLSNPNEYSLVAVSLAGKRISLGPGEDFILFQGNLSALGYETSRGFIFRGYDKPQGAFKIKLELTSSCFVEFDQTASIKAHRSGK